MKRLNSLIPGDASVAASESLVPHVGARLDVYTLKDGVPMPADYVVVNGG
jgi:hypothetical protein